MYVRVMLSVLSVLIYSGIVHAAPFAYIANNAGNTVSVIDTADDTVLPDPITVGSHPYGVAVNRMGSRVYVSNEATPYSVSVIDTFTNTVTGTISLSLQPGALAVNSAGTRLFITHPINASLSIYDTATLTQVDTTMDLNAAAPFCTQPSGIVAGPADVSGNYKVYVSCFGTSNVGIITYTAASTSFAKSSTAVSLTNMQPQGITTSKDGARVYVAGGSSVALINVSGTIASTPTAIFTDAGKLSLATGIAANPAIANSGNATKLYVTSMGNDNIGLAVLTATGDALSWDSNIPSVAPWGIAFTADGAKAVVANNYSAGASGDIVSVITNSGNLLTTVGPTTSFNFPKSFGKFAGPDFTTLKAKAITWSNCGTVTPNELITSPQGGGNINDYNVALGEPVTFSINKDPACSISNVYVYNTYDIEGNENTARGTTLGPLTSYEFTNPTTLKTIDAEFTRNTWTLALTKSNPTGGATGTVKVYTYTGSPNYNNLDFTCGPNSNCTKDYAADVKAILLADAGSNLIFDGFKEACSGTGYCLLDFNDTTVIAGRGGATGTFTVEAQFSEKLSGPFRTGTTRGSTTAYASTLPEAYTAVSTGGFIDLLADTDASITDLNSTLAANASKTVTLVGGWVLWTDSAPTAGKSSKIVGGLVVSQGSLIIGSVGNLGAIVVK